MGRCSGRELVIEWCMYKYLMYIDIHTSSSSSSSSSGSIYKKNNPAFHMSGILVFFLCLDFGGKTEREEGSWDLLPRSSTLAERKAALAETTNCAKQFHLHTLVLYPSRKDSSSLSVSSFFFSFRPFKFLLNSPFFSFILLIVHPSLRRRFLFILASNTVKKVVFSTQPVYILVFLVYYSSLTGSMDA